MGYKQGDPSDGLIALSDRVYPVRDHLNGFNRPRHHQEKVRESGQVLSCVLGRLCFAGRLDMASVKADGNVSNQLA